MTDLLDCPFCGGKAEVCDIEDGENAGGSCVACTGCMASSKLEYNYKDTFVEAWNARTPSAQLADKDAVIAELVGALRNIIQSAKLLQQNSEGCAVNHFAHDFNEQGFPSWLADTQAHIVEAEAALAKQGGSDG
jgi:hypothetical protein